jgi:protein-S-isoprenylcysteine O-methyltransferase Ste14
MRALELKVPPPVVALLIGAAMWAIARRAPSLDLPLVVRGVAFALVAFAGGAIALAGELAFRRAKTTINPFKPQNATALVTSGVYRFTRNPMYLGLTLVIVGWAAFLGAAWALLGAVAFVLYIDRFQIAPEERVLAAKFGEQYGEYTSRVRRWL